MTEYKMTDEDKKRIFGYMGWKMPCDGNEANLFACLSEGGITCIKCEYYHPLDGNDMVAAMEKMTNSGQSVDWYNFKSLAFNKWKAESVAPFEPWLMQPARFFELMGKWLKEKEHENSRT